MNVYFDDFQVVHTMGQVLEENHYYPFGMLNAQLSSQPINKPLNFYKYNDKELQKELNLEWLDYGARMYDPILGVFHKQDKFAEKYCAMTLYQYGANNPIYFVDVNGDSTNVALIQRYDQKNNTNIVQKIINDLQSQTGLTYSVTGSGQLVYQTDKNGTPVIATTTDANGNTVNVGSQEARCTMIDAIDNTTTAYARITSNSSSAPLGGTIINLNESQINSFISGANNVDSRTQGWGMTFMHELSHSTVGGTLSDWLPQGSLIGQVENRMNIIRNELDQKGGNYGQRVVYQATSFSPSLSPAYLPFDNTANSNLIQGLAPACTSKFIFF